LRHSHSLLPIGSFTTDLPFGFSFEDTADTLANNLVIVGDQYLYGHLNLHRRKTHRREIPSMYAETIRPSQQIRVNKYKVLIAELPKS
jgi:hypothetical protein